MKLIDCNKELEIRNIEYLCHFTCMESVNGILKHGIQPKEWLRENEIDINCLREGSIHYEGNDNAVSYSIEFPNYKMLWKLMNDHKDVEFVIIVVEMRNIKTLNFNAYSKNASFGYGSSKCKNFKDLFHDINRDPDLQEYYPTNPQAEIQVFGGIKEIYRIYTMNEDAKSRLVTFHPHCKELFEVNDPLFRPREDYSRW